MKRVGEVTWGTTGKCGFCISTLIATIISYMHKYGVVGKHNFSRESCLTKRLGLSEGVNGYLDEGGLVNIVYVNFFRALSASALGEKKAILFIF